MTSGYRAIDHRVIGRFAYRLIYRAVVIALVGLSAASCRLGTGKAPDLAGPSMFGVSLAMSATPDLLQRDGRTTSTVTVSAFGPASQPVPGVGLHLALQLSGGTGGLGTLSHTNVTTGADGRAVVTYTSPLPAPLGQADDATVNIIVTPVGSNASSATSSAIAVRLVSPDAAGGPTASFVLGPKTPKVGDTILFDASASQPSTGNSIIAWAWDFGDGNANPRVPYLMGTGPTMTHEYNKSGVFTVGLTIIDSAGKRSTATYTLVVAG
jgi:hypothetical protein